MVEDITILKTDVEKTAYPDEVINPDTAEWFEINELPDAAAMQGTALDASIILDAPAGKHGFICRKGDSFYFEDGKKINFWGCNIVSEASFLEKSEADVLVNRIAAAGYNLVRFHHIDAPWCGEYNVFGGSENTMELNDAAMDKFSYFWAKLKARGIYFMIDPMCSRVCKKENEGIDTNIGFKAAAFISEEMQALQKDYAKKLLKRVNPYTGTCLIEDPALVFIDIINEDSLFWGNAIEWHMKDMNDPQLYDKFCLGFTDFLRKKYKSDEMLRKAWAESGKEGLPEDESLDKIVRIPFDYNTEAMHKISKSRLSNMREYICGCHMKYYKDMIKFYREELGAKCMLCGSNAPTYPDTADLYANTMCGADFVDQHAYYAGTDWGIFWLCDNLKLYTAGESAISGKNRTVLDTFSNRCVYGFPFVQSEWNQVEPNIFSTESMTMMAAYGRMKNYNPFIFAFLQGRMPDHAELKITFNVFEIPTKSAIAPALGIMFNRGDVSEAEKGYYVPVSFKEAAENPEFETGIDFELARLAKTGLALTDLKETNENFSKDNGELSALAEESRKSGEILSVTRELLWNKNKMFFSVDTPCTQGCVGFLKDNKIKCGSAEFNIRTLNANVILTSLDGNPINKAEKMLLCTAARWRMTDMEFSKDAQTLISAGKLPMIAEPVTGDIIIKSGFDYDVFYLDTSGRRMGKAKTERKENGAFKIILSAEYKTFSYEIIKK